MSNTWLRDIFKNIGKIFDVFVSQKRRKNKDCGFSFIKFERQIDVETTVSKLNGFMVKGYSILVSMEKYKKDVSRVLLTIDHKV